VTRSLTLLTRSALAVVAPMVLGACTVVGSGAHPATAPDPVRPANVERRPVEPASTADAGGAAEREEGPASGVASGVVELALESLGAPYEWGGTDANGFDCSGLIQFSYARYGIQLPRVSTEQLRTGSPVHPRPDRLRPGDILGFAANPGGKTSHVGLYVGRGEFIHSSSRGVRVSTLGDPYWQQRLVAARRVVD